MAAPRPAHEEERLEDVQEMSPSNGAVETLRDISEVATEICETRWGALTLVEEDRQRILAQSGDALPDEMPRDQGFCPHAVVEPDEVFVVPDAREDETFGENPLVAEDPGIRFYAGAPLRGPRGHGVGTVCVLDRQPGRLDPGRRQTLQRLAHVASLQLRLNARTRELERANEDLEKFSAFVSHELTDPLSQVSMNLELISQQIPTGDRILQELVDEALEGGRRMERLTRDLLHYARASHEELETERIDLDAVARGVLDSQDRDLQEQDVSFELGGLGSVRGDRSLIRQVLQNLVQNAIEHGGPAPRIRIRYEREDGFDRIEVRDDGPGVEPGAEDQLFELFGPSASGGEGSHGVGLAFCKRVVERHGGRIGVDSEPGEGSSFWFTLPAAEP